MDKHCFGIDLSLTGSGFAVIYPDNTHKTKVFNTPSTDEIEKRLESIWYMLKEFLIQNNYNAIRGDIICVENLAYGAKGKAVHTLAGLHFFIRVMLKREGMKFEIITPSALKKFVIGKGGGKGTQKRHMLLACYKYFGIEFMDDNECDAYCLAQYGLEKIKKRPKLIGKS